MQLQNSPGRMEMISNQKRDQWFNGSARPEGSLMEGDPIAITQLIVNILGVLGNSAIIILLRRHSLGGRLPTIFFSAQAIFDLIVNIQALIFGATDQLWNVTPDWWNLIICKLWHSQLLFWFSVQLSIGNLVLISMERYLAIVWPMTYQSLCPRRFARNCLLGNCAYSFLLALPNVMETRLRRGTCISQFSDATAMTILYGYAIIWFVFIYLAAMLLLLTFYGGVIFALRRSVKFGPVQLRSKATLRFTRLAIVITIVYLASISYDAFCYLFGRTGFWVYRYNSLWHNLGLLSVSVNSSANPMIYYVYVLSDYCNRGLHSDLRGNASVNTLRNLSNKGQTSQNADVADSEQAAATI